MNLYITCIILQTLLVDPADLNAELFDYMKTKPDYNQGKMYLVIARISSFGSAVHVRLVPVCEGQNLKPGDQIRISVAL